MAEDDWLVEQLTELERLQTEAARLREALEALKHADGCYCEAAFAGPGVYAQHTEECEAAQAALSTNDWLEQHDEEVKREFLDSLCEPDIIMAWVEYEIDSLKGWHAICRDYEGTDEIAVKYFGDAAAIREGENA